MVAATQIYQELIADNVIEVDFSGKKKSKDNVVHGSQAGVSKEVYAFTSQEEIKSMIDVFDKHIKEAATPTQRQICERNKMLFLIGMNVGLRASDLCALRYSFFFEQENGNIKWKEFYSLQPKKQRKYGKFVKIYFNKTVKKAISDYIEKYPVEDLNEYMFKSRKGNEPISENALWRIVKATAKEAGIDKNIGSHSLRKSWGWHIWHNAQDKSKALVMIQQCMNHSDTITTMRYIGIMDEEKKDLYESVEIGLDYI